MFRSVRSVLRRDIVLICLVMLAANLVMGLVVPTFPVYAVGLGASLALVGLLGATASATQFLTSPPLGAQFDRLGRPLTLAIGLLLLAAALAVFAFSPAAWPLLVGRVLLGLASVAIFTTGAAYVGEIIQPQERGPAFGLYAAATAAGLVLGPLVSAALLAPFGIAGSYLAGLVIALLGAALALGGLRDTRRQRAGVKSVRSFVSWRASRETLREPPLLAVSLGNLLTNATFGGLIATFFPLYAAQLGAAQVTVNMVFAGRALASTLSRWPLASLVPRASAWLVLALALALNALLILGMALTANVAALAVLLIGEGIAYAAYLSGGSAFVAQHTTPMTRGTAIGVYSLAGSLGALAGPLMLGVIAEVWGVRAAFWATALLAGLGLLSLGWLYTQRERRLGGSERAPQPALDEDG